MWSPENSTFLWPKFSTKWWHSGLWQRSLDWTKKKVAGSSGRKGQGGVRPGQPARSDSGARGLSPNVWDGDRRQRRFTSSAGFHLPRATWSWWNFPVSKWPPCPDRAFVWSTLFFFNGKNGRNIRTNRTEKVLKPFLETYCVPPITLNWKDSVMRVLFNYQPWI